MTKLRILVTAMIALTALVHASPVFAAGEPSVLDNVSPTTVRGGQSLVVRQTLNGNPNPGAPGDIIASAQAGLYTQPLNLRDLIETATCRDADGTQLFAGKLNQGFVCPIGDLARDEVRTIVWNLRVACQPQTTVFRFRHQLLGTDYGSLTANDTRDITIRPCGYSHEAQRP